MDRDPEVRNTLAAALETEGYYVEDTGSGDDALHRIGSAAPDAIVVDWMTPGTRGRPFLASLQDDLDIDSIPILLMTAVPGVDLDKALAMGASDVVEKPIDAEKVLNKLALALFRAQGQRSPSEEIAMAQVAALTDETDGPCSGNVVLIVDDDRRLVRHLDDLIGGLGYTVVSMARVTDELTRLARVLQPRAIFLALDVRRMGGVTALRRMRAEAKLDRVPIAVLASDPEQLPSLREDIAGLDAEAMLKPLADDAVVAFVSDPPRTAWRSSDVV